MCRVGDLIVIENYITEDGVPMGRHSFVVLDDEDGEIQGMPYDLVTSVLSSFKSEEHKAKKLRYIENMLVTEANRDVTHDNHKEGYVKCDQFYYFQKDRIEFTVIGNLNEPTMEVLFELLEILDKKGVIKISVRNLVKE